MLYLFLGLKIPHRCCCCWLVWWAIKAEPEPRSTAATAAGRASRARTRPRRSRAARGAARTATRCRSRRRACARSRARAAPELSSRPLSLRGSAPAMPTSVLSDGTIRRLVEEGRIVIDPWDPALVQPASVDLRLGDSFRVFHNHRAAAIDLREPPTNLTEEVVDRAATSRS